MILLPNGKLANPKTLDPAGLVDGSGTGGIVISPNAGTKILTVSNELVDDAMSKPPEGPKATADELATGIAAMANNLDKPVKLTTQPKLIGLYQKALKQSLALNNTLMELASLGTTGINFASVGMNQSEQDDSLAPGIANGTTVVGEVAAIMEEIQAKESKPPA